MAIKLYKYAGDPDTPTPTPTTNATEVKPSNSRIKLYDYSKLETPPEPEIDTSAPADDTFWGIVKNTVKGIPKATVDTYKPLFEFGKSVNTANKYLSSIAHGIYTHTDAYKAEEDAFNNQIAVQGNLVRALRESQNTGNKDRLKKALEDVTEQITTNRFANPSMGFDSLYASEEDYNKAKFTEYQKAKAENGGVLPKKDAIEQFGETKFGSLVPFAGSLGDLAKNKDLLKISQRINDGTATESDFMKYSNFIDDATQDQTTMAKVVSQLQQLAPYAIEFSTTDGVGSYVKASVEKSLMGATAKTLEKFGENTAKRKLAELSIKGLAKAVQVGTVQTGLSGVTRIPANTVKNMLPAVNISNSEKERLTGQITENGEPFWKAFTQAFGSQFVETLSEHSGKFLSGMGDVAKGELVKTAFVKALLKNNTARSVGKFMKAFTDDGVKRLKAIGIEGFDGVFTEMLEERVGDIGHGIMTAMGLDNEKFKIPTAEDLLVELVSFSVPSVVASGSGALLDRISAGMQKTDEEKSKEDILKGVQQYITSGANPDDLIQSLVKVGFSSQEASGIVGDAVKNSKPDPEQQAKEMLDGGMSPTEVVYNLSQSVDIDDAKEIVDELSQQSPQEVVTETVPTEVKPKREPIVGDFELTMTPADLQDSFTNEQNSFAESEDIKNEIADIQAKLETAIERSAQKKKLKIQLAEKQKELRKQREDFDTGLNKKLADFKDKIETYVKEQNEDLSNEQVSEIANTVSDYVTEVETRDIFDGVSVQQLADSILEDYVEKNPIKKNPVKKPVEKKKPESKKPEKKEEPKKEEKKPVKSKSSEKPKSSSTSETPNISTELPKEKTKQAEFLTNLFKEKGDAVVYAKEKGRKFVLRNVESITADYVEVPAGMKSKNNFREVRNFVVKYKDGTTDTFKNPVFSISEETKTELMESPEKKPVAKDTNVPTKITEIIGDKKLTPKQKVQKLLDQKQESKQFKDKGERVAGSKKENATIRAIIDSGDAETLTALIQELGIDAVASIYDKEAILKDTPKPDIEQDKKDKVPAYVAGGKQKIFRLVNNKPNIQKKTARSGWYFESNVNVEWHETGSPVSGYMITGEPMRIGATKIYPDVMRAFVADLTNAKTGEEMESLRKKMYYFTPEGKQIEAPEEGNTQPYFKFKTSIFGTGIDTAFDQVRKNGYRDGEEKRNTDYDAYMPKKAEKKVETNLEHGNFAPIETYEVDEKRIPDSKVTVENLTKIHGFKTVQLGNYVDDVSAQEHIRQTMGALEDMGKMLGVDFALINNEKGLSIAYGARGGGRFLAHYEPTNNIINITKKRGDGSFGHEYAHFLDWLMGGEYGKLSEQYKPSARRYYIQTQEERALMRAILTGRDIPYENKEERRIASDFFADSVRVGGGSNTYWTRKHELFARAFQSYVEDKMESLGIENSYVTRPTKDIPAYPQGIERAHFNTLFDAIFAKMAKKYPYTKQDAPRFKASEASLVLTKAGDYLKDVKERLKIDFDVQLFDKILYDGKEALGAVFDNTMMLASFDEMTKAHETMHIVLANANKMPIFKKAGISRKVILEAKAKEMGVTLGVDNFIDVEEALASEFEKYLAEKYKPKGIIARFFEILRIQFAKFKRAIRLTEGSIIEDFYTLLDEGIETEESMIRFENTGIIESFLDDTGVLDLSEKDILARFRFKDTHLAKLGKDFEQLEKEQKRNASKLYEWREELLKKISEQARLTSIVVGADQEVKDLSKYTYRTTTTEHQMGQLTKRGQEIAQETSDKDIQEEVRQYMQVKSEMKQNRTQIQKLRQEIRTAKESKRVTSKSERELKRKLRKRQTVSKYMERGFEKAIKPTTMSATKYGKKAKAYEIKNRQALVLEKIKQLPISVRGKLTILVALRNAVTQDAFNKVNAKVDAQIEAYNKAKEESKVLARGRSTIAFIKHIGEMDSYLMNDVKRKLGIDVSVREMSKEQQDLVIDELKKRLAYNTKTKITEPMTEADYNAIAIRKAGETKWERFKKSFKDGFKEMELFTMIDKALGASATRLFSIDPELSRAVRNWYIAGQEMATKDYVKVEAFAKGMDKMKKTDRVDYYKLDALLRNRNLELAKPILEKHGMEYEAVKDVLEGIYNRASETNIDMGKLSNYFPRALKESINPATFVEQKVKLLEKRLGRDLSQEERQAVANSVVVGFDTSRYLVNKIANMKERMIDEVTDELTDYYEEAPMALSRYIRAMNINIETRRFFGKFAKNADLNDKMEDTIGAYVMDLIAKGKITYKNEQEISDILKGIFSNYHMSKPVQTLTNMAYLVTMGTRLGSAITQTTELAYSLAKSGFWGTGKGLYLKMIGEGLSIDDLYLDTQAFLETGASPTATALQWSFLLNGISLIDQATLTTFINGRLAEYRTQATKNSTSLQKKLQEVFGEDTDTKEKVRADLRKGEISDEVKRLIIDDVLDFRPQGATEKSEGYNRGGYRIWYTLKQFTLKQFDIYRKQVYLKIRNGIRDGDREAVLEGVRMFVTMTTYMILLGVGADELKDWIFGRTSRLSDLFVNNALKLAGLNTYTTNTFKNDGAGKGIMLMFFPAQLSAPADAVSNLAGDIVEGRPFSEANSTRNIPLAGDLIYYRFGKGKTANEKKATTISEEDLLEQAVDENMSQDDYLLALEEIRGKEMTNQQRTVYSKKLSIAQEYGDNDQNVEDLASAKSNEDKVLVLEEISDTMDSDGEDFLSWLENANSVGLVSDNLYDLYFERQAD